MNKRTPVVLLLLISLSIACNLVTRTGVSTPSVMQPAPADSYVLVVASTPEMEATQLKLAEGFNRKNLKTYYGHPMSVKILTLTSQEMLEAALQEDNNVPFHALNPDSSIWLNKITDRWNQSHPTPEGSLPFSKVRFSQATRFALTPLVIGAWENVARTRLGYPEQPVRWDILKDESLALRWTHPGNNNISGILATLVEFYISAGIQRGLTPEIATSALILERVRSIEKTVSIYSEGEQKLMEKLSPDIIDALVLREQAVIQWNASRSPKMVALYPVQGTLWADYPIALMEPDEKEGGISDDLRETYRNYVRYLKSIEAQKIFLLDGYRPVNVDVDLLAPGSPFLNSVYVNVKEPRTGLQVPSAAVTDLVMDAWKFIKKPSRTYLIVDLSDSMRGAKLAATKEAVLAYIEAVSGLNDELGVIGFSDSIVHKIELQKPTPENKQAMKQAVASWETVDRTALIDTVGEGVGFLLEKGVSGEVINALVVMTDGMDTASMRSYESIHLADAQVKVFTVAFGSGPTQVDEDLLQQMADDTQGSFYRANEINIKELYKDIAQKF